MKRDGLCRPVVAPIVVRASALGILRAVRFLLILVVAVLVPIQAGWASIASVCADMQVVGEDHFGHHSHVDGNTHAGAESSSDLAADDNSGDDRDCPTCHLLATAPTPFAAAVAVPSAGSAAAAFVAPILPRPPPDGLLRPPSRLVA